MCLEDFATRETDDRIFTEREIGIVIGKLVASRAFVDDLGRAMELLTAIRARYANGIQAFEVFLTMHNPDPGDPARNETRETAHSNLDARNTNVSQDRIVIEPGATDTGESAHVPPSTDPTEAQ